MTRTETLGRTNRQLLCLSGDSCFKTDGLTRSGLCLLSFTMLVLHPASSCDICYDTYGQENPASTIPCGHIFCYRYASLDCHRCDTRHFRLSVFPRVPHPQMPFRMPTERVPVVSKEVLEFLCHET